MENSIAKGTKAMSDNLYFAYGSNLNQGDFRDWCRERGYQQDLLQYKGRAHLPDFDLAFSYRSATRQGGVLDIRERTGQLVPGVLFEVRGNGWSALDEKEGAPNAYQRTNVAVLDERGAELPATTYRVNATRAKQFVKPNERYVAIVQGGLEHWGLSNELLLAAAANKISSCPQGFFFYGTLMRGESRFRTLRQYGIECVLLACTFGRLMDMGEYPGLVDLENDQSMVQGEFVRLRDAETAIPTLDAIEGFRGFGKSGSLYRRTCIGVDVGEGRIRSAWTYCLESKDSFARSIPSGNWRAYRGYQESFLMQLAAVHAGGDEGRFVTRLAQKDPFCFGEDEIDVVRSLLPLHKAVARGLVSERKLAQISGLWKAVP
jgi:gamma-glutamylcyclotransferase (GGCT)/AIG2-like uncharacterized protein YtfP